jgi:hypothetical protein
MWDKGPLSIDRARSIRTLAAMGSPPGGEYSLAGKDSARGKTELPERKPNRTGERDH